jgi:hypothetical protein
MNMRRGLRYRLVGLVAEVLICETMSNFTMDFGHPLLAAAGMRAAGASGGCDTLWCRR